MRLFGGLWFDTFSTTPGNHDTAVVSGRLPDLSTTRPDSEGAILRPVCTRSERKRIGAFSGATDAFERPTISHFGLGNNLAVAGREPGWWAPDSGLFPLFRLAQSCVDLSSRN